MEEIWKDIPGYEKYYMASTLGTCIERTSEKQRLTRSNCITIVGYKENEIIEFHSISSASRYFNVSHAAISKVIRRGNKCKGYNWKYKI